jgi:hypothetical protein
VREAWRGGETGGENRRHPGGKYLDAHGVAGEFKRGEQTPTVSAAAARCFPPLKLGGGGEREQKVDRKLWAVNGLPLFIGP